MLLASVQENAVCGPFLIDRMHDTHLGHVSDAQHEANRVEDVGFARAIEAGNGVKRGVPPNDLGANRVGFEACEQYISRQSN